jgi:hypothetical protein
VLKSSLAVTISLDKKQIISALFNSFNIFNKFYNQTMKITALLIIFSIQSLAKVNGHDSINWNKNEFTKFVSKIFENPKYGTLLNVWTNGHNYSKCIENTEISAPNHHNRRLSLKNNFKANKIIHSVHNE